MSDLTDRQKLLALVGDQECECCGIDVSADSCDVVGGEVTCLDCVEAYYPAVFARRSAAAGEIA